MKRFDAVIIGGGIIGCGIARQAARAGLSVALIEKNDFGSGTTAKTSKLIHGGLRYLRQGEIGLVLNSLREAAAMKQHAPNLISDMNFSFPIFGKPLLPLPLIKLGIGFYNTAARRFNPAAAVKNFSSVKEATASEPTLQRSDLIDVIRYHDKRILSPERLCLENALDAQRHGAVVLNHHTVIRLVKYGGRIIGVEAKENEGNNGITFLASVVINAAGPWLNQINLLNNPNEPPLITASKGIHLFTRKLSHEAITVPSWNDGRVIFIIPWRNHSLIGTTEKETMESPENAAAEECEVQFLIDEVNRALPAARLSREDVFFTYAGLRPLLNEKRSAGKPSGKRSRKFKLIDHRNGMISVAGGKMTLYRLTAEKTVKKILKALGRPLVTTREEPLGQLADKNTIAQGTMRSGLEREQVEWLAALYGNRMNEVLEVAHREPFFKRRICRHHPDILAQVVHAVEKEMCRSVSDFFFRRTLIAQSPCKGMESAELIAEVHSILLGRDRTQKFQEINRYRREIEQAEQWKNAPH